MRCLGNTVIYRYFFFFLLLFSTCVGQAKNFLSPEESGALRNFFQVLFQESEAGYVFLQKKPVCISGFYSKDPFNVDSLLHKESVALREGSHIWKKLAKKNTDMVIHISEKEDPLIPGWIHVLVIHRPLFQKAVRENLSLFQYVLGPSVTPENLLDALTAKDQTYCTLLKGDKVLTGKILGFGIQNSLCVSRIENLQEANEIDTPPFLKGTLPSQLGFGYKSANEELEALEKKIVVSSAKLTENAPEFIFGCMKDTKETKMLVSKLEAAQAEIQMRLKSPAFLEKVIKKIAEVNLSEEPMSSVKFSLDREKIHRILAKGIWESVQNYDFEYLGHLITGMENQESCTTKREAWFPEFRKETLIGKENLQHANARFQTLDHDSDYTCILPEKLYYKTIRESQGEHACDTPLVSLSWTIFSPSDQCLAKESEISLDRKSVV